MWLYQMHPYTQRRMCPRKAHSCKLRLCAYVPQPVKALHGTPTANITSRVLEVVRWLRYAYMTLLLSWARRTFSPRPRHARTCAEYCSIVVL